jgi:hypothetical protein
MDKDMIFGSIAVVCALGFITYIVLWSRRTIRLIAGKKYSLRDILDKLHERR